MTDQAVPAREKHLFGPLHLSHSLSNQSPQPLVALEGAAHVVRYTNPAFARLAGEPVEALVGRPFAAAVPEGEENGCLPLLERVFRTGTPEHLAEQEHRHATPIYWSYAAWAILGTDGRPAGVMVQVTDTTETALFRRRAAAMNEALVLSSVRQHELIDAIQQGEQARRDLEVQMFHAQKFESLGVLAGGIAHDLNNILSPVLGFSELARECLPKDSPAAPMLDDVMANARRAADLVQQILAYAGKGRFVVMPVDVSHLVREMSGLLGTAVAGRAEIRYELAAGLPPVIADATQLRQLVTNLIANADEAIAPGGGTITVRTSLTQMSLETLRSTYLKADLPAGPYVSLEIADTGCGMTAAVVAQIFDPFFTTKFTGRGLGLAAVQGIARGHRGVLQVRSEPGTGSTFRLLLPCSTGTVGAPDARMPTNDCAGGKTVLVVDDEIDVRKLTSSILTHAGFAVLTARDGKDGLEVFRNHPHEIDIVVLDMTMPGMSGLETAAALQDLRPGLPVLLMSGFSVCEMTLQSTGYRITGFLHKPFSRVDLIAAIRLTLKQ